MELRESWHPDPAVAAMALIAVYGYRPSLRITAKFPLLQWSSLGNRAYHVDDAE